MEITIHQLLPGAREARGIAVIIDVFRAYSVESYAFAQGMKRIYPVGDMEEAYRLKQQHPDYLLCGEREGRKQAGCDFGNSPLEIIQHDLTGRSKTPPTQTCCWPVRWSTRLLRQNIFAARTLSMSVWYAWVLLAAAPLTKTLVVPNTSAPCCWGNPMTGKLRSSVCVKGMGSAFLSRQIKPSPPKKILICARNSTASPLRCRCAMILMGANTSKK